VSAPYEPPEDPELRIRGAELALADAVESALGVLAAAAAVPRP
jgi:adenylylsulfate kinase-like enzyme